jgi:glycosyltransferase involved in cell wall biosynthesis
MEFVGTDARLPSIASCSSPYYVAPPSYNEEEINRRLADWADLCTGHVIVADHNLDGELSRHFEKLHIVGLRVDTRRFTPAAPDVAVARPVVLHAPSNPLVKGTEAVRRSVHELQAEGIDFEYVEIHGMTHTQAHEQYKRADLVIDQLCIGAHGVFALEAMSLAKPVICYIRPDLVSSYPADLPVINANPDNLTPVLRDWLHRGSDRRDLGLAARLYAERHHDIDVVARRLLEVYEQLPSAS